MLSGSVIAIIITISAIYSQKWSNVALIPSYLENAVQALLLSFYVNFYVRYLFVNEIFFFLLAWFLFGRIWTGFMS
jgi:hypothetical protein